jgi:hypothetical protein
MSIDEREAELLARIAELEEDQARRDDSGFYLKQLFTRSCVALGLDEDSCSWFDVVGKIERLKAQQGDGEPVAYQYEVANQFGEGTIWTFAVQGREVISTRALYASPQPSQEIIDCGDTFTLRLAKRALKDLLPYTTRLSEKGRAERAIQGIDSILVTKPSQEKGNETL